AVHLRGGERFQAFEAAGQLQLDAVVDLGAPVGAGKDLVLVAPGAQRAAHLLIHEATGPRVLAVAEDPPGAQRCRQQRRAASPRGVRRTIAPGRSCQASTVSVAWGRWVVERILIVPPGGRSWVRFPRYASAAPTARGRHRSAEGPLRA